MRETRELRWISEAPAVVVVSQWTFPVAKFPLIGEPKFVQRTVPLISTGRACGRQGWRLCKFLLFMAVACPRAARLFQEGSLSGQLDTECATDSVSSWLFYSASGKSENLFPARKRSRPLQGTISPLWRVSQELFTHPQQMQTPSRLTLSSGSGGRVSRKALGQIKRRSSESVCLPVFLVPLHWKLANEQRGREHCSRRQLLTMFSSYFART